MSNAAAAAAAVVVAAAATIPSYLHLKYCNCFGIADETATLSTSGVHAKLATGTR